MAEGDAVSIGSVEGKQQPHFHSYLWEKVEKQRIDGKYRYLVKEVISSPEVLSAAYEKIRLGSNLASQCGKNELAFDGVGPKWYHWVGGQLVQGTLDVKSLCHLLSSHKDRESSLILPSLHLKIIQIAVKMVLEVIFEPRFSAISHGCRAGRGRHTAMRDIKYAFCNSVWFMPVHMHKRFDSQNMQILISILEDEIQDIRLFGLIWQMFHAGVLHLEIGGYPKGYGLPQEGILTSILINIYLNRVDREFNRVCQTIEAEEEASHKVTELHTVDVPKERKQSWDFEYNQTHHSISRVHACRYIDEMLVSTTGSKKLALDTKDHLIAFLSSDLRIEVDLTKTVVKHVVSDMVDFLGIEIHGVPEFVRTLQRSQKTIEAMKKLQNRVKTLALQKQIHWEAGLKNLGNKLLIHALKKAENLAAKNGQSTDQVVKQILSTWAKHVVSQSMVKDDERDLWLEKLSKGNLLFDYLIREQLPQELTDSFDNFLQKAKDYLNHESVSVTLCKKKINTAIEPSEHLKKKTLRIVLSAPMQKIKRILHFRGLINCKGNPQPFLALVSQDDKYIIQWFGCLAKRFLSFYSCCDNFSMVKGTVNYHVRWSCIQTLAAKHKANKEDTIKKFTKDLITNGHDDFPVSFFPSESKVCGLKRAFLTDPLPVESFLHVLYIKLGRNAAYRKKCNVSACQGITTESYLIRLLKTGNSYQKRMLVDSVAAPHSAFGGKVLSVCEKHYMDFSTGRITLQALGIKSLPASKIYMERCHFEC